MKFRIILAMTVCLCGLFLSGCIGGGSTEAGNPDLILKINGTKNNETFNGYLQFFVEGQDPTFFTFLDDGFPAPVQVILGGEGLSAGEVPERNIIVLNDWQILDRLNIHPQQLIYPQQALLKTAARTDKPVKLPPFNIVLVGFDSTVGLLTGIHRDSLQGKLRYADGSGADTLVIDITVGKTYSGTLDTAGLTSKPLGLYVPGTPYFAQVDGDSFKFEKMPSGKLPLRMISADGWVHAMDDSLGAEWTQPLVPGERLDSLNIPAPNPVLASPSIEPAGQLTFTDSVVVSLTAETGATIYYTLDGNVPNLNSKRYTSPFTLISSNTVKAIAFMKGHNRSPMLVHNYFLVPAAPVANPTGKEFRDSLAISLSVKAKSDIIYYTLDGSSPSEKSLKYTSSILIQETTTLKAITYSTGLGLSGITEEKYVLVSDTLTTLP